MLVFIPKTNKFIKGLSSLIINTAISNGRIKNETVYFENVFLWAYSYRDFIVLGFPCISSVFSGYKKGLSIII